MLNRFKEYVYKTMHEYYRKQALKCVFKEHNMYLKLIRLQEVDH